MNTAAPLEILVYDSRLALRGFRRRPFFTAMIVATLALGVGANATMFGIIDRLLLTAPPHIADPDRVALLNFGTPADKFGQTTQPYVVKTILERQVPDFAAVAVATTSVGHRQYFPVGRGLNATRVAGSLVSSNYFSLLGVKPALGRFFVPEEEVESNQPRTIVLGYGYWQRRYGGRADALGQRMEIGPATYTIVGVAPRGFTGTEMRDVDVWLPIAGAEGLRFVSTPDWATSANAQWLIVLARLEPGARPERAAAQASAAYAAFTHDRLAKVNSSNLAWADSQRVALSSIIPGKSGWTWGSSGAAGDVAVSKLLGGVALMVLLIACANVANLLLVRALGRRREIAVRLALGVSRPRLVTQLLIEGMLLAAGGTACALGFAAVAGPLVRRWLIGDGAWTGGELGARMLIFTAAVGLVTALVTSLVPALQASRPEVTESLKAGAREGSIQKSHTRTALLVAQAALALMLLGGAGMFVRSLRNAANLDIGIDRDRVLVVSLTPGVLSMDVPQTKQLFERLAANTRSVPGITGTATSIGLPFSLSWGTSVFTPGRTFPRLRHNSPMQYAVTPGYFDVLGIRTLLGRAFDANDRPDTPPVAVINETMARLYFPNENPIGMCLQIGADTMPCNTIVGVVSNTRRQSLVEGLVPQVYRPLDQVPIEQTSHTVSFFGYTLVAHTTGDASNYTEALRRAIQATSSSIPYANVQTMESLFGRQTRNWELGARVFSAFGALALLVAAIGMFSVVAFTIAQRTHEFGVRAALGAQRTDILRLTIVRGVTPAIGGIVLGVVLSLIAGRFLESLLFEISPRDPATLGAASGVMFVSAVLASLVPAWRASRVDPTISLRAD